MVNHIYLPGSQLSKAYVSDSEASCLDLHLSVLDGFVQTKVYDKQDFGIVNFSFFFSFLDGAVPRSTSCCVYIFYLFVMLERPVKLMT